MSYLDACRYVLHDRDTKFCASFRYELATGGKTEALPARSPTLNAFVERWLRPAQEECLSKLILFGEGPLSRTLAEPGSAFADYSREQPRLPDTLIDSSKL
jgi:hypothetical protein